MPKATTISKAITSTLSYHSRFSYPLTFDELHRFLVINRPLSSNEVKKILDELVKKQEVIKQKNYYSLPSSFVLRPSSFTLRPRRAAASAPKLHLARRAARLIGLLPWVKLICVTGSLAMENSDSGDDIDLMIVISPNRLWLTRPLVILLISLFFKRRKPVPSSFVLRPSSFSNTLCLNLWLDASALAMPPHRRDLRTAHELAQMQPLINKNHTYEKMLLLNKWGKKYLANFWNSFLRPSSFVLRPSTNNPLNLFNLLLFRLQYAYMKPKITSEEVNLHSAFFHPKHPLLLESAERILFVSRDKNRKLK